MTGNSDGRGSDLPRDTRFKPGQSGNPAGRPKGSRNYWTMVKRLLDKKVTVTVSGKAQKMSLLEANLMRIGSDALNGDKTMRSTVLQLGAALAAFSQANDASQNDIAFEAPDEDAMARIVARLVNRSTSGKKASES
jgi:hypothetical protein